MVHIDVSAQIPLPVAEYWAVRTTPEFLAAEVKVLKNASKVITKTACDDNGRVTHHQMKTKPDLSSVPAMLMRMLPAEGIVYTDEIEYITDDAETPYACRTRTFPNIANDNCDIVSYMRILPDPENPNACIQTMSLDVNVSVWMVSSAIEALIANGVRDGYNRLPQIVEHYLQKSVFVRSGSCDTLANYDSDYGSLSDLSISDADSIARFKTGVKREHESAPGTPSTQPAGKGSRLRSMLSLGAGDKKKSCEDLSASLGSLNLL